MLEAFQQLQPAAPFGCRSVTEIGLDTLLKASEDQMPSAFTAACSWGLQLHLVTNPDGKFAGLDGVADDRAQVLAVPVGWCTLLLFHTIWC